MARAADLGGAAGVLAVLAAALAAPVVMHVATPGAIDVATPHGAVESVVEGAARVVDGDTLEIGAARVRLLGIDAPEIRQRCGPAAAEWDCGRASAARLTALAGAAVRCAGDEHDRYGRLVATCSAGGIDLGGSLVAAGLAWAYVRYSEAYVTEEADARRRGLGIWRGPAEPPWEFRAAGGSDAAWSPAAGRAASIATGQEAAAAGLADRAANAVADAVADGPDAGTGTPGVAAAVPSGCGVKGNIAAGGERIYHLPGEPSYAGTRIDPRRGEAWFCDEASARAAGFRPRRSR